MPRAYYTAAGRPCDYDRDEWFERKNRRATQANHNAGLRMAGRKAEQRPLVPLPPPPCVAVAYEDGEWRGVLEDADECPAGMKVRFEPIKH